MIGIIVEDDERDRALADLADDSATKALLVRIDSPGGTVVGGETLYRRLRQIAEHKPVVAVMGELATSAAYMTAIGSDWIVAREGTLTGSIGVIMQTADFTGLLDKIGVKPETVKSSPLKAQPNPLEPFYPGGARGNPSCRRSMSTICSPTWCRERRKFSAEQLAAVADGSVFTGRQAQSNGLDRCDRRRGRGARLAGKHSWRRRIAPGTRRRVYTAPGRNLSICSAFLREKCFFLNGLNLDGLISVWHPEL